VKVGEAVLAVYGDNHLRVGARAGTQGLGERERMAHLAARKRRDCEETGAGFMPGTSSTWPRGAPRPAT
jgi:hypothetical protein